MNIITSVIIRKGVGCKRGRQHRVTFRYSNGGIAADWFGSRAEALEFITMYGNAL